MQAQVAAPAVPVPEREAQAPVRGGLVNSTFGTGTLVSSYDPLIQAKAYNDHFTQLLTNQSIYGVSTYRQNENLANASYIQSFPTGTYFETDCNNNRQTSNSPNNSLIPQLNAQVQFIFEPAVACGFRTRTEPALSADCQDQSEDL